LIRGPAIAEGKRRRGDAADDDDSGRGTWRWPVDPAAETDVLEPMALHDE
jgi:hypothetical protein